jgi:glycosyltransferase involved in cell wall biosynthesis
LPAQFADAADDHGLAMLARTSGPLREHEACGTGFDAADQTLRLAASKRKRRPGPYLKLSIIMAVYNEQETIEQAVSEVLEVEYPCDMELIVVDDGSRDDTPRLLADIDDPRVTVFRHARNYGKGAAILAGVDLASGTHILPFDADLEYMSEDIVKVLEPVRRGRCSVVFGVRLFGYNTVYRSYIYALGNRMMTRITNIMFGACLSDLHTCLKLIPIDLFRSMRLTETGFGLDTEISASLLRRGVRPFEVPVSYFSRSHEEGKKITWRDAFACLWILIRVRTLPRSRFLRPNDLLERNDRNRVVDLEPGEYRHWPARTMTVAEAEANAKISVGLAGAE